jgi:hypothetical protein
MKPGHRRTTQPGYGDGTQWSRTPRHLGHLHVRRGMCVKERVPGRGTRLQRVGCRGGPQSDYRSHLEGPEGTDHSGDGWRRARRSGLSLGEPLRGCRGELWKVGRGCRTAESGHRSDTAWAEHPNVTHKGILLDVACPSTTVCLAVGWGASQPSVAVPIDPRTGALSKGQSDRSISARAAMLTAVSCPSRSLCLAVGNDTGDPSVGQAVPIDPKTATIVAGQSIQTLAGTGALNAVVCPSAGQCVAAGSSFESAGAVTEILDPATGRRP